MTENEKHAAAGAALLDEKSPGWANSIKLSQFDIESTCDCVLGQVYGNFLIGYEELFCSEYQVSVQHGFQPMSSSGSDIDDLESCWVEEIAKRRKES